ncbi:NAD(P)/FAD-dependent oxidoreductase [Nakamurella deserti]|uniref:NAD(P)/FAD-dependent oxidoreductase n=1 Tax=Nakamurella deserti TaxID=2164074 RepID=UPI00197B941E|nr:FAD-dependent oxidoreductase [Nakamurella deserti]
MVAPLWWEGVSRTPRDPLPGDRSHDVAIVGAGFTGLWTAWYLRRADPSLRIVVLEREYAGFGASGRNGGWASDLFPVSDAGLAHRYGRDAARAMRGAVRSSIDEIEAFARGAAPGAHVTRGGELSFARTPAQRVRAQAAVRESEQWGEDVRWLDPAGLASVCGVTGALGATFTPHCAAVDPGALVRGLADAVVGAGVTLHESTAVTSIAPGRVVTDRGTVTADVVVRATEAYTAGLPGATRALAPVYSLITATETLTDAQSAAVGLLDRPTFGDHGNLVIYGQRTHDGRIVFGGRGAPYHFGSRIRPEFDADATVFASLRRTLVELFPALRGIRFTHAWGGPLGIPRDWHASVGFDRASGTAWAGGYVGDGVSTSNLAGRTLADLITGTGSELVTLPWVNHRSRRWEPEPLRWAGINGGLRLAALVDRREAATGRPSRLGTVLGALTGD